MLGKYYSKPNNKNWMGIHHVARWFSRQAKCSLPCPNLFGILWLLLLLCDATTLGTTLLTMVRPFRPTQESKGAAFPENRAFFVVRMADEGASHERQSRRYEVSGDSRGNDG